MLTPELIERYQTEVDVDWRQAFVFEHPRAGTIYLINHTESLSGLFRETLCEFLPVPVETTWPTRDDSGTYEINLSICGVGGEAKTFLDKATKNADIPVSCFMSIFVLGDPTPQIDPWIELHLTGIVISLEGVAATATRVDIINRPFPRNVYRLSKYPGLRRG
jgi:hypothetical protein